LGKKKKKKTKVKKKGPINKRTGTLNRGETGTRWPLPTTLKLKTNRTGKKKRPPNP